MTEGLRFNEGKLPYHLIPEDALEQVAAILGEGAKKYAARNWQRGLMWDEGCAASLQRHLAKWKMGEDVDPDDGMLHIAKVMVNAMFLTHFYLQGTGQDDRFKYKERNERQ